jgi:hypothetical protein
LALGWVKYAWRKRRGFPLNTTPIAKNNLSTTKSRGLNKEVKKI